MSTQSFRYPNTSSSTINLQSEGTPGSPVPSEALYIAGQDNSGNLIPLHLEADGKLNVLVQDVATQGTLLEVQDAVQSMDSKLFYCDTRDVAVTSSVLPAGAATEATLAAIQVDTGDIDFNTYSIDQKIPANLTVSSTRLLVDGSGVTQPISAASLPLPTGAATEATLSTASSTLTTLNGKVPSGLTVTSTRLLVDGSGVTQPISAASLPLPTGAATESTLSAVSGKLPSTLGQKTMANSLAVVLASDQTSIPVVATPAVPAALTVKQAVITVGTSAVRLTTDGSAPSSTRRVLLAKIDPSSSANFWVGSSSVASSGSSRGIPLTSGSIFTANDDAGDYYIISDTSSQSVFIVEQE